MERNEFPRLQPVQKRNSSKAVECSQGRKTVRHHARNNETNETASNVSEETIVEAPEENSVEKLDIMHMEIDTRLPEWCWAPVTLFEMIKAIQVDHKDDYTKTVIPMWGRFQGIFKLDADEYENCRKGNRKVTGTNRHGKGPDSSLLFSHAST